MSDPSQIPLPSAPPPPPAAEDDGLVPLHSGLRRLVTSAKAIVALVSVVGVIVMNMMGKIDGPAALNFVTVVVCAYFGAHAIEDGAEKAAGGRKPSTAAVMSQVSTLLPQLTGLLGMITGGGGNAPQEQPVVMRARGPVALRPLTPEERERMLAEMIAPDPPSADVIPIRGESPPPEKPPTAG